MRARDKLIYFVLCDVQGDLGEISKGPLRVSTK